jgi:hypothetical protein
MSEVKVIWKKIIVNEKPVVKFINLGNGTQFKLISFFIHSKLFVALERVGAFFFDMERVKSGDYVSEKLNIPYADAYNLADWINVQCGLDIPNQGHYNSDYLLLEDTKHYEKFDLKYQHTIHPIIIN